MSDSLFDVSVTNYLQILNATEGVLAKGKSYCEENNIDLEEIVDMRLISDMNPFRFQVISVAHHSMGALKGLAAGEFSPPSGYGEPDYAGLQDLIRQAKSAVESYDRETVESFAGKTVTFKLGGNELPFTAENFVNSFSLPNFFFHATTTYALLRMKGVPLGKRDFLGTLRLGV